MLTRRCSHTVTRGDMNRIDKGRLVHRGCLFGCGGQSNGALGAGFFFVRVGGRLFLWLSDHDWL